MNRLSLGLVFLSFLGCKAQFIESRTEPVGTNVIGTLDGSLLYQTYCAQCHGPLTTSAKAGRTSIQITTALSTVPNMRNVTLTSQQIEAIAYALGTVATGGIGGVVDGAALYAQNCQSCHQPLLNSVKRGRTPDQITSAISTIPQMRNIMLTPQQIQAIATSLL